MTTTNNPLDATWITRTTQGGPYKASVVIKANPRWVSTVTNRLQPYKNFPEKYRPAIEAVADYMRQEAVPRIFKNEGPGWRGLSKRSQKERAAAGFGPRHPILVRTGDLFRELTDKSHPKHVEIIKVGPNARLIFGGRSEKFVRNQLGSSLLNIPPRPMIPGVSWMRMNGYDQNNIKKIITDKINEAVKK